MARQRRYPSDLTGELVKPLLPAVNTGGRPEKHPRRAIVDAILYVVRTGCSWRQLPADFPPWQTVYWYFSRWEEQKATEAMLAALREQLRVQQGRNPQPSRRDHRLASGQGRRHRRARYPWLRRSELSGVFGYAGSSVATLVNGGAADIEPP